MAEETPESTAARWQTSRRRFLAGVAAAGLAGCTRTMFSLPPESAGWSGLPPKPDQEPLDFGKMADAFDSYVMDPAHGVNLRDKTGRQYFASALETTDEGGVTCYGPVAMGKELRSSGLDELARP